jgi:hypothetical protein
MKIAVEHPQHGHLLATMMRGMGDTPDHHPRAAAR